VSDDNWIARSGVAVGQRFPEGDVDLRVTAAVESRPVAGTEPLDCERAVVHRLPLALDVLGGYPNPETGIGLRPEFRVAAISRVTPSGSSASTENSTYISD
jgi:hypothetical protein